MRPVGQGAGWLSGSTLGFGALGLALLLGGFAAVGLFKASSATETAKAQAAEIVALREASATNKADHEAIKAQLARIQTSVDELLRGSRA